MIGRFDPIVFQKGLVFMAHDQGRLCGVAVNDFMKVDHSKPELDTAIPEDFSDKADQEPLSHVGARTIIAIW